MSKKVTERITWVGKIDWDLRKFHGDEYETHKGSSYNAFLIRDEKTVLIDTVWKPFDEEFVAKLKEEIDLKKIDYIVCLHGEVDHSGALLRLMEEIPGTPIYCTANGVKSIRGQYHKDWNFIPVKTGDTLSLGETTLTFVEATMLHWPDTMFAYLSGEEVLFSSDGFGQHYASEKLFADLAEEDILMDEALKYYANILAPFCPMVTKKIRELQGMNLPIRAILPSHGVLWRKNPMAIVEKYLEWAEQYKENKITILYDTMWNNTRIMAESIAQGLTEADPEAVVKLFCASKTDKSDLIAEVFRSRAIVVGSSTVNNGYLYAIAGILELIKGCKLKGKKAAAFGSYGWSGEAVKLMSHELAESGFTVVDEGIRTNWTPDDAGRAALRQYGRELADKLK